MYADPVSLLRLSERMCPECGSRPDQHHGWGGPDGCTLTDYGVAIRLDEYEKKRKVQS